MKFKNIKYEMLFKKYLNSERKQLILRNYYDMNPD